MMKRIFIKGFIGLFITLSLLILCAVIFLHGWVVPHMNEVKPWVERYLSERINQPVRIGSITAKSSSLLPTFDFNQVQILDSKQVPALQLKRIEVDLTVGSLLTFDVDQLVIDSPILQVARNAAGQITIAGWTLSDQSAPSPGLDWVFSQKKIVVRDGTLEWRDEQAHFFGASQPLPQATLTQVAITLHNGLYRHHISISAKPPSSWGESFAITGKFTQPLLERHSGNWRSWKGELDIKVDNIPHLASSIKTQISWPFQSLQFEGEHVSLDRASEVAKEAGYPLPQDAALNAILMGAKASRLKLDAQNIQTDHLTVGLDGHFEQADVAGSVKGTWKKGGNYLDAQAQISRLNLAALPTYISTQRVPAHVRLALQGVIQKGVASDVDLRVKGALKDFPWFNASSGELRVSGKVVDAQWVLPMKQIPSAALLPPVQQTNFTFSLTGKRLEIKELDAKWLGLSAKASLQIPDLRKPVVQMKGEVTGEFPQLVAALKTEPFKTASHDVLSTTHITGPLLARFDVSIPVEGLEQTQFTAQLKLQNNDLVLNEFTPPLSKINGKINLSRSGFELEQVSAKALGGEIKLAGNQQKLVGTGFATAEGLVAWTQMPLHDILAPRLRGKAPYRVSFEPKVGSAGLVIESSLAGMGVSLPAPLAKSASATWPLRIQQMHLSPLRERLLVSVGSVVAAEYLMDLATVAAKSPSEIQGAVKIGTDLAASEPISLKPSDQGIYLAMFVDELDLAAWNEVLPLQGIEAKSVATGHASYMPNQLTANIHTLKVANRNFKQVTLGASRNEKGTWRINANADHFSGYGEYRPASSQSAGQVYLRLAKLIMPDAQSQSQLEQLLYRAPERMPALDVVINDFELMGKKVGQIEIFARNQRVTNATGKDASSLEWKIEKLNVNNSDAKLKAHGAWVPYRASGGTLSRKIDLSFNLDALDSGALLTRFGLPNTLKQGKAVLQGRVAWVGSPWSINYPTLMGQLKLNVAKGQFLKVEPGGAGRFFSIFSLQALPKLLTLDFRDVFSDGFAFDSIEADAQIKNGILSTENLEMKSTLALVSMSGTVDLSQETQNLRVLVLPDINAGGASLIATLVNPIAGAAAYLTQLMLKKPLIAAATKEYSIKGSWREPVITQIKKTDEPKTP